MIKNKIFDYLKINGPSSDWGIANGLYNNCMNKPHKSNGARIANIRKACHKSELIGSFISNEQTFYIFLGNQ